MIEKVRAAIKRYGMLKDGEKVLVALSGGADSVALLLCIEELGYDVFAVHVNHNLRGEESLRDQHFCEELCRSKGIQLYVESVDVRHYCEEKKLSVELGARELRYNALRKHSEGCKIATAHTLSDVLETTIFNFLRGCGVKGLAGIPPVRGEIIRPIINCTRAEIEKYLRCKGQDFVTDSTNLEADCSRNIIRLNVIPELKKINSGLEKSFYSTLEAIREADGYIESRARKQLKKLPDKSYDFTGIADDAIISRAISIVLNDGGIEPSYERITSVREILWSQGRINLKKGVYLRADKGRLIFEYDHENVRRVVKVTLRCDADLGDKVLTVTKISPFDISGFNKSELKYMLDEAKMCEIYTARGYIGSEKIRLPNRGISSTVKKLLADLPRAERRDIVVLADGYGAVFVEGIGVSERVCCDKTTASAVRLDIRQKGDGL